MWKWKEIQKLLWKKSVIVRVTEIFKNQKTVKNMQIVTNLLPERNTN